MKHWALLGTNPHQPLICIKKHPLHNEIRVALNKHRELRTPKQELLNIIYEVETRTTHKRLLGMKNRPLLPKVQDFMTITASKNVDAVVSFLNAGTACNFNYVSDLSTAFAYFSIPQNKFLAIQHQLKEVLFYLGLYNFVASTHTAISKAKEKSTNNSCAEDLEAIKRWNAYGYMSVAKMAIFHKIAVYGYKSVAKMAIFHKIAVYGYKSVAKMAIFHKIAMYGYKSVAKMAIFHKIAVYGYKSVAKNIHIDEGNSSYLFLCVSSDYTL